MLRRKKIGNGEKEVKNQIKRKHYGRGIIKENIQIYALMLPTLILIFTFCYLPMYGVVIAFQDYVPGSSFLGSGVKWVGLKWFKQFVGGYYFRRLLKNTITLSLMELVFGFTAPILFALLLDQIRHVRFKKAVQTISYMPHFISMVVVAGMVISFVDVNGMLTNFLTFLGLPRQNWRVNSAAFPWVYTFTNVWKGFGFGSILYCSVISAIDPGLYEAAKLDGANRWQQAWHITLPGIKPVIAIKLITTVGHILSVNSDFILLYYLPATYDVADVIGTYTYRLGILEGQYSYTTAAGIFTSIIAFTLTYLANKVSNRLADVGLW